MASQELKLFLSGVDSAYLRFADVIHRGQFISQAELTAAERKDLEDMGIPKGAAGLIIASARDTDLIKLRGNVKVLKKGDPDPETGETKSISLYRSKDDPPSLKNKNGRPVGRLYLKNVNVMVPVNAAMIEVVAPKQEIRLPFLPEENSNGLSEELFAFDSIIKVTSFTGLSLVDEIAQGIASNGRAFAKRIGQFLEWRHQLTHPKPDEMCLCLADKM